MLFMAALATRGIQPLQHEPARTAQSIVLWYAGRMWTLWLLLILLPIVALAMGCATLLRARNNAEPPQAAGHLAAPAHAPVAMGAVAVTTVLSAGILAVVVVHLLTN
jgi:hypothetical protein